MISQTAEYALRAVVALAQHHDKAMVTPQIAKVTKVPAGYLAKVLQTLGRHGLVQSRRGIGGGFTLARDPAEISVLDVVNAVDPVKRIHRCPLQLGSHQGKLCPLHRRMDEATAHVEQSFAETTIDELLHQPGSSTPLCETHAD
jgi:Rrf2 family nitric oxide-sensitive transcriptional repressor